MFEETTVLPTTHPDADTLAAFGRGELPPADLAAVAEHVSVCDTCCAALAGVRDDTLINLARDAAANTPATPPPAGKTAPAPDRPPDIPSVAFVPAPLLDHPRYRILGELGEGGMGVVYKAEHRLMDRVVALKVMAPHLTARPAAVERFHQEVRAAAKLDHQNIVRAHDAEEAGGMHFLVMEYVEGISLDRLVARRGPLPVPMACQFARQVALGLQHASDRGMVHRDIKPQNLMVTRKGLVKILDFGLARFARDAEAEGAPGTRKAAATAANVVMGTPDYLSPEQARSSSAVDIRSDVYSLGCTLYFLLTGRVPFPAATTLIDKLLAHTEEEPAPVVNFRLDVPDALAAVLGRMMAKKPADRFQTPTEAAAALAPFAKGTDVPAAPAANVVAIPVPAGRGVVDAVLVAPPATPAAPPVGDFEFDADPVTTPEAKSPTLPADEPRQKRRKKAARPSFVARNKKVLAVAGVVLAGLLAGAAIRMAVKGGGTPTPDVGTDVADSRPPASNPPAAGPPGGKPGEPSPALPDTNPWRGGRQLKVLYVLPNVGLWLPDYTPVREKLEQGRVTVVTAAARPGQSFPARESGTPDRAVPIDVVLSPDLDVSGYAGVIFCGRTAPKYDRFSPGAQVAKAVIEKMRQHDRVVAAICEGQGVLAVHGLLKGKPVAANPATRLNYPFAANWQDTNVVVDGKLVTAARPEDADEFAAALLKVLRSE